MESILKKEEITTEYEGSFVEGLAFIQSYNVLPQKNGGKYIMGQLQVKGQMSFKVWSNCLAFSTLTTTDLKGTICRLKGKIDKFGGTTSIIVESVVKVEDDSILKSNFFEDVYNAESLWGTLSNVLMKNCSEDAYAMFNQLIEPYYDRFINECAAVSHHDNCKSGLLAHTTKVVRMASLIKMYPEILARISPDLLFISCAIHDIGKIFEYSDCAMSGLGIMLSHHTFGVKLLLENKKIIIESMGENFFYKLLAVVEQHHGEYEERPRTVVAYVVHLLDTLESQLASLNSVLAESDGSMVQFNGFKLV